VIRTAAGTLDREPAVDFFQRRHVCRQLDGPARRERVAALYFTV